MKDRLAFANQDMVAGVIFSVLGLVVVAVATGYPFGSTLEMGPGFFPTCLGVALTIVGIAISLRSAKERLTIERMRLRPLLAVLVSVVAFGLALKPLGLFLASILLVVVSALGSNMFRWRQVVLSSVVLASITTLTFVGGLKIPIAAWPF